MGFFGPGDPVCVGVGTGTYVAVAYWWDANPFRFWGMLKPFAIGFGAGALAAFAVGVVFDCIGSLLEWPGVDGGPALRPCGDDPEQVVLHRPCSAVISGSCDDECLLPH